MMIILIYLCGIVLLWPMSVGRSLCKLLQWVAADCFVLSFRHVPLTLSVPRLPRAESAILLKGLNNTSIDFALSPTSRAVFIILTPARPAYIFRLVCTTSILRIICDLKYASSSSYARQIHCIFAHITCRCKVRPAHTISRNSEFAFLKKKGIICEHAEHTLSYRNSAEI
jgi:hypothetical protein